MGLATATKILWMVKIMPMAKPVFLWNQLPRVGAAVTVLVADRPKPMGTAATNHIHISVNMDMQAKGTSSSSTATVMSTDSLILPDAMILPQMGMPSAMNTMDSVTYRVNDDRSKPSSSHTG